MCFDMCTHKHYVTNKYTNKRLLVPCGKCPECLQDKANRNARLIRQHYDSSKNILFVTLTYDRISCPYIRHEDIYGLHAGDKIPIYREYRITRSKSKRNKRVYQETKIGEIEYDGYGLNSPLISRFKPITNLKHRPYGGVCFYKDFQDFTKRLRINLKRHYGFDGQIEYFACSEYGSKTKRPHFHLLLFYPAGLDSEAILRPAVIASWPYASKHRTDRGIEHVRRDASGYVASYINCFHSISAFLRGNFPPKRTFSKYFGKGSVCSSLSQILDMFDRKDFTYGCGNSAFTSNVSAYFAPARNIAYYFPIFKGYSRLSPFEVSQFVENDSARFVLLQKRLSYRVDDVVNDFDDNYHKLMLGYARFKSEFQFGDAPPSLYGWYYVRVWSLYNALKMRFCYENNLRYGIPLEHMYDNISDVYFGTVDCRDGLVSHVNKLSELLSPNQFPHVVSKSRQLERYFWQRDKQKKVSNIVYDAQGFNI